MNVHNTDRILICPHSENDTWNLHEITRAKKPMYVSPGAHEEMDHIVLRTQ